MGLQRGKVVRLDRGYPLVALGEDEGEGGAGALGWPGPDTDAQGGDSGRFVRCEHATALVKGAHHRAAIGDEVLVQLPEGHDKGIIQEILPRATAFVRKDPAERTTHQVLAANFHKVLVVEPMVGLNRRRLERELVLACDTGAQVAVVLTKADLAGEDEARAVMEDVRALTAASVPVVGVSLYDSASLQAVRKLISPGQTAILIGKSGVGKSSLVNALVGCAVQDTGAVRGTDGKGRHTTVDRVLVPLPEGGAVVDMPGLRGLGLWDADQGLGLAFSDVEGLAAQCRFRDCAHGDEPGCAVREAVAAGALAAARVESYRSLAAEIAQVKEKRARTRRPGGRRPR